jgi:hypothetical protein
MPWLLRTDRSDGITVMLIPNPASRRCWTQASQQAQVGVLKTRMEGEGRVCAQADVEAASMLAPSNHTRRVRSREDKSGSPEREIHVFPLRGCASSPSTSPAFNHRRRAMGLGKAPGDLAH